MGATAEPEAPGDLPSSGSQGTSMVGGGAAGGTSSPTPAMSPPATGPRPFPASYAFDPFKDGEYAFPIPRGWNRSNDVPASKDGGYYVFKSADPTDGMGVLALRIEYRPRVVENIMKGRARVLVEELMRGQGLTPVVGPDPYPGTDDGIYESSATGDSGTPGPERFRTIHVDVGWHSSRPGNEAWVIATLTRSSLAVLDHKTAWRTTRVIADAIEHVSASLPKAADLHGAWETLSGSIYSGYFIGGSWVGTANSSGEYEALQFLPNGRYHSLNIVTETVYSDSFALAVSSKGRFASDGSTVALDQETCELTHYSKSTPNGATRACSQFQAPVVLRVWPGPKGPIFKGFGLHVIDFHIAWTREMSPLR
jgi:hypothetical protein